MSALRRVAYVGVLGGAAIGLVLLVVWLAVRSVVREGWLS